MKKLKRPAHPKLKRYTNPKKFSETQLYRLNETNLRKYWKDLLYQTALNLRHLLAVYNTQRNSIEKGLNPEKVLERFNSIMEAYGVEITNIGYRTTLYYVNTGDVYNLTILYFEGNYFIADYASAAAIIERKQRKEHGKKINPKDNLDELFIPLDELHLKKYGNKLIDKTEHSVNDLLRIYYNNESIIKYGSSPLLILNKFNEIMETIGIEKGPLVDSLILNNGNSITLAWYNNKFYITNFVSLSNRFKKYRRSN